MNSIEGTHFSESGATQIANLVAQALKASTSAQELRGLTPGPEGRVVE
jgi:hypothetical protein